MREKLVEAGRRTEGEEGKANRGLEKKKDVRRYYRCR